MTQTGSRVQQIMDLWEKLGRPMSLREFTRWCRQAGIWTQVEWDDLAFQGARQQVHNALKQKDRTGRRFAGPSPEKDDSGAPLWKQRTLWELTDYQYNIDEQVGQLRADYHEIELLREECHDRYGVWLNIPRLEDA